MQMPNVGTIQKELTGHRLVAAAAAYLKLIEFITLDGVPAIAYHTLSHSQHF